MLFGAHEHHNSISSLISRNAFATITHQRAPTPQSRKPCRQKHGFLSLSRVQGGSACSESRGEAFGPRHFAGFRRKTESVIVGSYTFAESAVPTSPRAPNATYNTHPRKEAIPWQETMAWTAPPSATSPEPKAMSPTLKPTMSARKHATRTRILSPNAAI